ncbi:MAG: Asp-tRNA(Asn)/Glu-tRNA(Gln) amidotransferase subunit GatC [Gammaproteobacteria bacterium]|nr:Asp-tRNA(Asn)/Glu-tRNA(Gln) amidotransferase subunit GatC [Gammaproteobacteria bacterium]
MTVNRQTIEELAELAKISISETTIDGVSGHLDDMLQLLGQLQTINTEGIQPMAHPLETQQLLRSDIVAEPNNREALLATAPLTAEGLFLVPKVID